MAYKHFADAVDATLNFNSATDRFIYMEICHRADRRGIVRMPQSEIAGITLLSPRTIAQSFSNLERIKLLSRIGHGRYQLIPLDQNPETTTLTEKLRAWIHNRDEDAIKDGTLNILAHEMDSLPDFVKKGIKKGMLKFESKGKVIIAIGETEDFTTYSIHL